MRKFPCYMTIFNCNIKENKGKRIYLVTFIKILVTINVLFFPIEMVIREILSFRFENERRTRRHIMTTI